MKKQLVAVALAALTLTGCAVAQPTPQPAAQAVIVEQEPTSIYEAVWQGWEGIERPDEAWIDTSAMLVCKQIIGGFEPRVTGHAENNEILVVAAGDFLCEIDRQVSP